MSAKVGPEPLHRTSDIRGSVAQEPDLFALVMKELQKKVVSMLAHFSSQYWGCDERIVLPRHSKFLQSRNFIVK